eukprot:109094-Pyramimonas_sp.AAC.1
MISMLYGPLVALVTTLTLVTFLDPEPLQAPLRLEYLLVRQEVVVHCCSGAPRDAVHDVGDDVGCLIFRQPALVKPAAWEAWKPEAPPRLRAPEEQRVQREGDGPH